ncbi:hypothetical protein [Methylobacterium aquaticum]|uniref:Uncharacterized protein n=1 Tax=Methylobacterium aquaticum TaxID=270351 RepID=A0A0C6FXR8_9HYPH|nr:hypothetical protein [Methylobacterium aquaticum]BAQ50389.1 hypothetical protein Maq22A_4p60170 [Methylobacterium aquaticum]
MRDALLPPALSDNPEIHAAVLHEREACAFLAEAHSGLWDLATLEQIAASIRARGEASARELVHLDPDRYGALLAAERDLQALKARTAPKDLRDAISAACFDPKLAGYRGSRTTDEWRADAVMTVLKDLGMIGGEGGRHG